MTTAPADPVAAIAWGDCLVPRSTPSTEVAARLRRERSGGAAWAARIAPVPWLTYAMCELPGAPFAYLPIRLWDLVVLVISRDNSCRFCWGAQRTLMRLFGYDPREIERLERDELVGLDDTERTALEFARKVSRGTPRPGAAELAAVERAGLTRPAVAELTFAAAAAIFANRVSTLLALPPEPFPQGPVVLLLARLLRPVIVRRFAPRRRAPETPPVLDGGVGADVVRALGDSPAAGALHRALAGAFASPVLALRSKLLILAVVARALDATTVERDAVDALAAGGLHRADVAEALAHLASPRLDARDTALLAFARETVRCSPAEIQGQLRVLVTHLALDVAQRLELVGMVALANALCRASVLVDPC